MDLLTVAMFLEQRIEWVHATLSQEEQSMREQLQTRLGELKKEFATGQARLQELEKQQMYLRETLLRISGAIQVLEELLAEGGPVEQNSTHSGEKQPLSDQVNPGNITDPALQKPSLEFMTMNQDKTARR